MVPRERESLLAYHKLSFRCCGTSRSLLLSRRDESVYSLSAAPLKSVQLVTEPGFREVQKCGYILALQSDNLFFPPELSRQV